MNTFVELIEKMNSSINTKLTHLPEEKQKELQTIIEYILETVPEAQMIILFGSYASGDYIEYDQRIDFGLRTFFKSDYDLLVLTPKKRASYNSVMRRLNNAASKFYEGKHITIATPIQFINESVEDFNKAIKDGRYFFTEILQTGILLYDTCNYKLEEIRQLNFQQIFELSSEYFNEKYKVAESFFKGVKYYFNEEDYKIASFNLHQAVENYLISIILVSSLYSPKGHNLQTILDETQRFTNKAVQPFLSLNNEDLRLFELLNAAYVQGRYNKDFLVTKEDVESLISKVEILRVNTKTFGEEKKSEHFRKFNK